MSHPVTELQIERCRPLAGRRGAVAAANPAAVAAGVELLAAGGSAVDAAIASQSVVCVTMPHAAGLGGDLLALVRDPDGAVTAVGGTGLSPARLPTAGFTPTGGGSVTVPGLVDGWLTSHARWGRLELTTVLAPAIRAARSGVVVDAALARTVQAQRSRLVAGHADEWSLMTAGEGTRWRQPALAELLESIAGTGFDAFYRGPIARAVAAAVRRCGGTLDVADLTAQRTVLSGPVRTPWQDGTVHVQPPPSQGVLLAMALKQLDEAGFVPDDHLLVELTEQAFAHRSDCARGADLLAERLVVDASRASRRGGPRAYLHTAGVATADDEGLVVSSLVSVFDNFGSAVFVPEAGMVLNNRAAGFTDGANAPAAGKRPVHTLAPGMLERADGSVLALATPGADGQVQTLLQVLCAMRYGESGLGGALAAPRWRSEAGRLLVERGHPATGELRGRGHEVVERPPGEDVFGAVVAAGLTGGRAPFAAADWRRSVSAGVT